MSENSFIVSESLFVVDALLMLGKILVNVFAVLMLVGVIRFEEGHGDDRQQQGRPDAAKTGKKVKAARAKTYRQATPRSRDLQRAEFAKRRGLPQPCVASKIWLGFAAACSLSLLKSHRQGRDLPAI